MTARGLSLRALRSRRAQSVLLLVLSIVAIAACAAGPIYERAVEQAAVRSQLSGVSTADRGVTIQGSTAAEAAAYLPSGADARLFGAPVAGLTTTVSATGAAAFQAQIVARDEVCRHLRIIAGACPTAGAQVLMSASSAKALKLTVGAALDLTGQGGSAGYRIGVMHVSGLYQPFDPSGNYWFDHPFSSAAGVRRVAQGDAVPDLIVADALFVTPDGVQFLQTAQNGANSGTTSPFTYTEELPVSATSIGVDQSARLLGALNRIQARIDAAHPNGDPSRGQVQSKLIGLLHTADTGRHQTRLIIPTLAVQLALVVLVVLGLVLAVGIDQRRADIGLARLRGRSRRGAARMFINEIAVLVGVALIPGVALAWLACALAVAGWLPSGTPTELRWPALAAAVAVALAELAISVVLARRTAAQPIGQLLRSVSGQRSGLRLGLAEVALGVAALAGVVVALTGDRRSTVSLVTPSLIAIVAGLILSRLLVLVARRVGARALWRGRMAWALATLQAARRPGIRRVVTLVCVAVALLVSAVDQQYVSAANRQARAEAQVGAPVVLTADADNAAQFRAAVQHLDPSGDYATPVILQRPDGGDTPVLAVEPASFSKIARWGTARDTPSAATLARLNPANAPAPIRFTGDHLQLRTDQVSIRGNDPSDPAVPKPISLSFQVELPDGDSTNVILPVATSTAPSIQTGRIGCVQGCVLRRIEVIRTVGDFTGAAISLRLLGLSAGTATDLKPVALGEAGDWQNSEAAAAAAGTAASIKLAPSDGDSLLLTAVSTGSGATLQHLDVPVDLPCLQAGSVAANAPSGASDSVLSIHGIDGNTAGCVPSGAIGFAPRYGAGTVLVDLDLSVASTLPVLTNSTPSVWLAADDPAREATLVQGLEQAGVQITGRDTIANVQRGFDQSPPAWAIRAALAAAVLAALIAALMIVIAAYTTQDSRSYDLAALRLVGVRRGWIRRAVRVEQLLAVLFAAIVGIVVGLVGARLALPAIPLFIDTPVVPKPSYATAWAPVAGATLAAVIVLVLAAFTSAFVIQRRIGPDRLRAGA